MQSCVIQQIVSSLLVEEGEGNGQETEKRFAIRVPEDRMRMYIVSEVGEDSSEPVVSAVPEADPEADPEAVPDVEVEDLSETEVLSVPVLEPEKEVEAEQEGIFCSLNFSFLITIRDPWIGFGPGQRGREEGIGPHVL